MIYLCWQHTSILDQSCTGHSSVTILFEDNSLSEPGLVLEAEFHLGWGEILVICVWYGP